MGRIFDEAVEQHDRISHRFHKEFGKEVAKEEKEEKCCSAIAQYRFKQMIMPCAIIVYFDDQVFCTQIENIQTFHKMDHPVFQIDLLSEIDRSVIQQGKDLFMLDIIDRRTETGVPGVGSLFIKKVVQHFEAFGLYIGIFGQVSTLCREHQLFMRLVVEDAQCRDNHHDQEYIKEEKPS